MVEPLIAIGKILLTFGLIGIVGWALTRIALLFDPER